jgi:pSer/pThr/pTyr-binding forkhead associated (FHA) protein
VSPSQAPRAAAKAPRLSPLVNVTTLPMLVITCGASRAVVGKDRFIIGRGKSASDFVIKDPNMSRQHAMVEFVDGRFFIADMGSTNGIEFDGQRVARKAIHEGDRFRIGDHEFTFSYRG